MQSTQAVAHSGVSRVFSRGGQSFLNNTAQVSGVRRKFPRGEKFRQNRVTPQFNFMESAEGTTFLGWLGGMPWENIAKLHLKIAYAFSCILEASFRIMLLRDLLEE